MRYAYKNLHLMYSKLDKNDIIVDTAHVCISIILPSLVISQSYGIPVLISYYKDNLSFSQIILIFDI